KTAESGHDHAGAGDLHRMRRGPRPFVAPSLRRFAASSLRRFVATRLNPPPPRDTLNTPSRMTVGKKAAQFHGRDAKMRLHQLIHSFDASIDCSHLPDVVVTGVEEDSRQVQPGSVFVARPGTQTDGAKYVADAALRGAIAVICEAPIDASPLPQVIVPCAAAAASVLAGKFYGEPSRSVKVLGITGTNGKTTTAYLIRHLLASAGIKCGLIGTVQIDD